LEVTQKEKKISGDLEVIHLANLKRNPWISLFNNRYGMCGSNQSTLKINSLRTNASKVR